MRDQLLQQHRAYLVHSSRHYEGIRSDRRPGCTGRHRPGKNHSKSHIFYNVKYSRVDGSWLLFIMYYIINIGILYYIPADAAQFRFELEFPYGSFIAFPLAYLYKVPRTTNL